MSSTPSQGQGPFFSFWSEHLSTLISAYMFKPHVHSTYSGQYGSYCYTHTNTNTHPHTNITTHTQTQRNTHRHTHTHTQKLTDLLSSSAFLARDSGNPMSVSFFRALWSILGCGSGSLSISGTTQHPVMNCNTQLVDL